MLAQHLVGPRPLEGRGVLWTLGGGVGWGGACFNVHVNLLVKDMLLCGCRQVHVFIGGVGWGGVGHVLTFM